jgi:hypothetical protein
LIFSIIPLLGQADEYSLWKQGRAYWFQDDWQAASEVYKQHIMKYPDSPRRCKSEIYLGYCYQRMDRLRDAYETFTDVIVQGGCSEENLIDAKSNRLELAFKLADEDDKMRRVLENGLNDANADIRLQSAVWLSELGDDAGLEVFFNVLQNERDQDRRDTAGKHILKLGSEADKARYQTLLAEIKEKNSSKQAKMVRLIVRDLENNEVTVKLNLPINLINIALRSLSEEQKDLVRENYDLNLDHLNIDLSKLNSGHMLFRIVDSDKQEVKVWLE